MSLSFRRFTWLLMVCLFATGVCSGKTDSTDVHVVMLGDSNTWLGGDNCDKPKGWNKWFRDKVMPKTCRSYARSGATWTNTKETKENVVENIGVLGNDNVIYNQIVRLFQAFDKGEQESPNLILISAGTNDVWFEEKRPEVWDMTAEEAFADSLMDSREVSDVRTLTGAMRHCCLMIRKKFPDSRIVILTPMQTTAAPTEKIHRAGLLMEECAKLMDLEVVRLDTESCVRSDEERKHKRFTYDGTHTSVEGAKRNGYMIAERVMGRTTDGDKRF